MEIDRLIERTELHDSSLVQISIHEDRVRLDFENVWIDDDNAYLVTIELDGVHKMSCDDKVVNTVRMKTNDAGVIAFKRSGKVANLVVTWTSYAPRVDETHSYQFEFTTFKIRAEKQIDTP